MNRHGLAAQLYEATLGVLFDLASKLVRCRELLWSLTVKEIKVRYKQSLLGIAWAVFMPVSMMLIFTFVFRRIAKIELDPILGTGEPPPYVIFSYCGLLPWNLFSQSLSGAVNTLVTNRSLLAKVYFPREVFPLSKILASFVDFLVASSVLVALMLYYEIPMQATLLWIPVLLGIQLSFMLGCALLLSMANLFYRDVQYVFQVVIQLWMFATSVAYPIPDDAAGPLVGPILRLNPMTPIIDGYRDAIIYGRTPEFGSGIGAWIVVAVALWLGVLIFDRSQYLFVERM